MRLRFSLPSALRASGSSLPSALRASGTSLLSALRASGSSLPSALRASGSSLLSALRASGSSLPARDGRQDRHGVAVVDIGVQTAGEPHVLVIDVDVDEPLQLAVIDEAFGDARVIG